MQRRVAAAGLQQEVQNAGVAVSRADILLAMPRVAQAVAAVAPPGRLGTRPRTASSPLTESRPRGRADDKQRYIGRFDTQERVAY